MRFDIYPREDYFGLGLEFTFQDAEDGYRGITISVTIFTRLYRLGYWWRPSNDTDESDDDSDDSEPTEV